jgi:hypothetical protein
VNFHSQSATRALCVVVAAAFIFGAASKSVTADDKADPKPNPTIDLADGKILLTAPQSWARKTPRVRIIEHEFAVPVSKGDKEDGRVTVMGAGGTVEANLDRWIAQFSQPDGSETKNQAPEADRKKTISGLDVQMIDLSGTFRDMPRPFDPNGGAVERPNYRMLAAVIASPTLGNYFIKFYGPRQTVSDHAEEFHKMIAGLQTK